MDVKCSPQKSLNLRAHHLLVGVVVARQDELLERQKVVEERAASNSETLRRVEHPSCQLKVMPCGLFDPCKLRVRDLAWICEKLALEFRVKRRLLLPVVLNWSSQDYDYAFP